MTREEAEEFWASEDEARKDYPGAIRSFVGTVQRLTATERERDELRATVARVEDAIHDHPHCIGECVCAVEAVHAALHPEQEAHDA